MSYAKGRSKTLSWQKSCSVIAREKQLIAVSCDVTFGSSGAPVFDASGWRPKIVSIISRGSRDEEGSTALGMELPKLVEDLYFALRTGKGVFPKPKTGALFVRP